MQPPHMLDHLARRAGVGIAAPRHADAQRLQVRHRLGHLQRAGQRIHDRHLVDARHACPRDRLAQIELAGDDRFRALADRLARRLAKALHQSRRIRLRLTDLVEGRLHQHGRQGPRREPEALDAQVHHLVEARLEREHHEAAAERAREMHGRLAVADHRNIDQRTRLFERGVLHRADGEHLVTLGLGLERVVEDALDVQRHQVGVDHDVGGNMLAVGAFGHAGEVHLDPRARHLARTRGEAVEIRRHAAAVDQALVPDAHFELPGRL